MDGVIVDTEWLYLEMEAKIASKRNIPFSAEVQERYCGVPMKVMWRDLISEYGIDCTVEELCKEERKMLEDFLLKLFRWSPFGIIELVLILLVLLVLIFVFWLIFRRRSSFSPSRPHSGQGPETAMDILKKRYARGEITRTEFEEMKRDIL